MIGNHEEYQRILQVINDKCRKLQYDDAELWCEFLDNLDSVGDLSSFTLAYVYMLQLKFGAAISILKKSSSGHCKFLLAKCYMETRRFEEVLKMISKGSLICPSSCCCHEIPFPKLEISEGDIFKLIGGAYKGLGDRIEAARFHSMAFKADPFLLSCYKDGLASGNSILMIIHLVRI